jgi:hypothetical protein
MFTQDFIFNGQASGPVASMIAGCRYDPGLLRPYLDSHGVPCVTVNTGRQVYDNKLRRHVPVYKKMPISMLQQRGINSPVFNADLAADFWTLELAG